MGKKSANYGLKIPHLGIGSGSIVDEGILQQGTEDEKDAHPCPHVDSLYTTIVSRSMFRNHPQD